MPRKAKVVELLIDPDAIQVRAISVDLGNAYSNLVADGGISEDWRSVQSTISDSRALNDLPFDDVIEIAGQWYVFGEKAYTYAPRTLEDFPATNRYTSTWYKNLFTFALHRAYGLRLQDGPFYPNVVLSIPASLYSNDSLVDKVRENLTGPYVIGTTHGTKLQVVIRAENLRVIPEGAGSYVAAAAIKGNETLHRGLWYVLDLGYLTADIVAFRDGDYIPDLAISDSAAGMSRVARAVARYIAAETGGQADLKPHQVDPDLRCETINVNGQLLDIGEAKNRAISDLGQRVARFIQESSAGQNLSGVLLTGGGAELVRDAIHVPNLPQLTVAPNPRRANVDGAFKMLVE